MKYFFYIALLLFAPEILAGPFDPPPTDVSVSLLGTIFGASVGNIPLGGNANPVMIQIMEKFNFIIVVVGTVVVSYVAILSTINTAHEGTAMGKKWSAIWIPMRSVAGMALMVPAPASGYSMIQVTVMWIIIQGIGAADALWNIALGGLANGVSAMAGTIQNNPQIQAAAPVLAYQVLDAAICTAALQRDATTSKDDVSKQTWVNQNGSAIQNWSSSPTVTSGYIGANNACVASSGSSAGGIPCVSLSGYSNFGLINDNSQAGKVCGSLLVNATVKASDFPQGVLPTGGIQAAQGVLQQYAQQIYTLKMNAISNMLGGPLGLESLAKGIVSGEYSPTILGKSTQSSSTIINQQIGNNPAPPGYATSAINTYVNLMSSAYVPQAVPIAQSAWQNNGMSIGQTITTGTNAVTSGINSATGAIAGGINSGTGAAAGGINSGTATAAGGLNAVTGSNLQGTNLQGTNLQGSNIGQINVTGMSQFTPITDNSLAIQNAIEASQNNGWIYAGATYFLFNETLVGNQFPSVINEPISDAGGTNQTIPSCDPLSQQSCYNASEGSSSTGCTLVTASNYTPFKNLQNLVISENDLDYMAQALCNGYNYVNNDINVNVTAPPSQLQQSPQAAGIFAGLNTLSNEIMNGLMTVMNPVYTINTNGVNTATTGDPLLAHAIFGKQVMWYCEATFLIFAGLAVAVAVASAFPLVGLMFIGPTIIVIGLIAILTPIIGIVWAFGAMLAIYMPLIPLMIFTMGALGWLLVVVEAIIAAPIVALGLVMPSGDEMGKLASALTILANIFLRPLLMIFGFMFAAGVYKAVVHLIDIGISGVLQTVSFTTMFSTFMLIAVYCTFIVSVTNTCFSLIYAIPDKVLRWIGGTAEHTDVGAVNEVKQAAQSTSQQIGSGVGGFAQKKGGELFGAAQAAGNKGLGKLTGSGGGSSSGASSSSNTSNPSSTSTPSSTSNPSSSSNPTNITGKNE